MTVHEHVVAVLALDGVVGFDLSIPCQVFGTTQLTDGTHPYLVRVCGPRPLVTATAGGISYYEIQVPYDLAPEFARRFPDVIVDAKALFTGDGKIFTSAGVAAGMDLCLHLIGRDYGAATAATAARMVVMAPTREGSQAQFITDPEPPPDGGSLAETLSWIQEHAAEPLTVADIARHAALSVRTLTRRFAEQLGTSPQNWLHQQRLSLARRLLETTDLPIPQVAERSGHGSANALRAHFARELGTSPHRYRNGFRQPAGNFSGTGSDS